jgi:hypothetical protein
MNKWLAGYEAIGLTILTAAIVLLVSIYVATNTNPNYAVTLYTNRYGENIAEVVLLVVSVPAGLLVLFHHGYELLKPTIEASRKRREERLPQEEQSKRE